MVELTNWLTAGISKEQLYNEKKYALSSFKIYTTRRAMGATQSECAEYLGISKKKLREWESGLYDFTEDEIELIKNKLHITD